LPKLTQIEYEGQTVPAEELAFDTDKEPWTVYQLEDGTVLKFKQVLSKVCRLIGKVKPDGEPIYVFNLGAITISDIPPELKKKKAD
jgi:hypothetical protein